MPSSAADSPSSRGGGNAAAGSVSGEIMLFGVRVTVPDPMRKSVSLNNLSEYEQQEPHQVDPLPTSNVVSGNGYASADDALPPSTRERKRGVPWTEDEHKLFLFGLRKVGKGDWRGISRNFVKTRTPTQVASHAQKYFLRRSNLSRRRRRSSLLDITTDAIASMDEETVEADKYTPRVLHHFPLPEIDAVPVHIPMEKATEKTAPSLIDPSPTPASSSSSSSVNRVRPVPILANPWMNLDLNLIQQKPNLDESLPLSLNLCLAPNEMQTARHSAFQPLSKINTNGDNILSVA